MRADVANFVVTASCLGDSNICSCDEASVFCMPAQDTHIQRAYEMKVHPGEHDLLVLSQGEAHVVLLNFTV